MQVGNWKLSVVATVSRRRRRTPCAKRACAMHAKNMLHTNTHTRQLRQWARLDVYLKRVRKTNESKARVKCNAHAVQCRGRALWCAVGLSGSQQQFEHHAYVRCGSESGFVSQHHHHQCVCDAFSSHSFTHKHSYYKCNSTCCMIFVLWQFPCCSKTKKGARSKCVEQLQLPAFEYT